MCNQLKQHTSDKFKNVDTPIIYIKKFDEYGLKILDGGSSSIIIEFCPWCGEKLPDSKRDRWFDELEKFGVSDPLSDKIPKEYLTDEWYQNRL